MVILLCSGAGGQLRSFFLTYHVAAAIILLWSGAGGHLAVQRGRWSAKKFFPHLSCCRSYHLAVVRGRWSAKQLFYLSKTTFGSGPRAGVRTEPGAPGSGTRQFFGSGPSPFPYRCHRCYKCLYVSIYKYISTMLCEMLLLCSKKRPGPRGDDSLCPFVT